MFVNEVDNDPAAQAVEIVLNYIKKNPSLGLSVQLMPIEGNRTDSKKFLESSKLIFLNMKLYQLSIKMLRKKIEFDDNQIEFLFSCYSVKK